MKVRAICLGATLLASLCVASPEQGKKSYARRCSFCHGADAEGGERGPAITGRIPARNDAALRDLIVHGIPGAGMPPTSVADPELADLVSWLRTLRPRRETLERIDTPEVKGVIRNQGEFDLQVQDDDGKLRLFRKASAKLVPVTAGRNWPTYHGQLSGNRHVASTQITPDNVRNLRMEWIYSIPGAQRLETTPVVIDGVMYVTWVNQVHAIDGGTGRRIWMYSRPRTKGVIGDAGGAINRGVAISGDRLFLVTDHAHLLALDRHTGALLWDVEMADYRQNYGATGAPLVVGDIVISGISGGDEGVRGFLDGYDVNTGKRAWRFWTVPARGEPGSETWQGSAIDHGCAATWMTGTYDPELDLLYWATGNPCPDYNGDQRKGDNLYSDSVLALRPKTGELIWYFQYTPHDLHDWDAQQTPMLIDAEFGGSQRRLLAHANRNGFFYILDRANGKLLNATPFVNKLTWAKGIGPDGRPILNTEAVPSEQGVRTCPAVEGATNWFSTAFEPATGLYFVQALEKCNIYTKVPGVWEAGKSYYDGTTRNVPGETGQKVSRALDLRSGKIVWQRPQAGPANSWGGVLATAAGLLFAAEDDGSLTALDSRTGKLLWRVFTNQLWKASPMSYEMGGRQYVSVAAGGNILAFALPE